MAAPEESWGSHACIVAHRGCSSSATHHRRERFYCQTRVKWHDAGVRSYDGRRTVDKMNITKELRYLFLVILLVRWPAALLCPFKWYYLLSSVGWPTGRVLINGWLLRSIYNWLTRGSVWKETQPTASRLTMTKKAHNHFRGEISPSVIVFKKGTKNNEEIGSYLKESTSEICRTSLYLRLERDITRD